MSWSVTISREIHRGNFSRVWRGTLSDGSPLVVKMYPRRHFDVMKKELKAYRYLYSHQLFDITPAYYGAFAMPDQYWAAIILADGGESGHFVDCSWKDAGLNSHELYVSRSCFPFVFLLIEIGRPSGTIAKPFILLGWSIMTSCRGISREMQRAFFASLTLRARPTTILVLFKLRLVRNSVV